MQYNSLSLKYETIVICTLATKRTDIVSGDIVKNTIVVLQFNQIVVRTQRPASHSTKVNSPKAGLDAIDKVFRATF